MLDSLTRWELQEVLMEVWSPDPRHRDLRHPRRRRGDPALRPRGDDDQRPGGHHRPIVEVDLPRPRTRKALVEHPDYYRYRAAVLGFLEEYEHGAHPKKDVA